MRKILLAITSVLTIMIASIIVVFGQDTERSSFIQFVEEQISSPSYQIRLNGLEGTLSSEVSLTSITVADEDGIWLSIEKPNLVWTRTALLRGRLVINSIHAERIDFLRKPKEDTSLPSPESTEFSLPQLPVAVVLEKLDFPIVQLEPDVIDLEAMASVAGKVILDDGSMDLDLQINRLDANGGQLIAISKYQSSDKTLELDVKLSEPSNGILASSIGLEGRPPVSLTLKGNAPLSELNVALAFDVDKKRILDGSLQFNEDAKGILAKLDMDGPISDILPQEHREFFGARSVLSALMQFPNTGGMSIRQSSLKSGMINLSANGKTTSDGFLSALNLDLLLKSDLRQSFAIPSNNNDITVSSVELIVDYDASKNQNWDGNFLVNDFRNAGLSAETIRLETDAKIDYIVDIENRSVDFQSIGNISGITANDHAMSQAIGRSIKLNASGNWQAGEPISLQNFEVIGNTLNLIAKGAIEKMVFDGAITVNASNLEAFSSLLENELAGQVNLKAEGTLNPLSGGFDLKVDGSSKDVSIGNRQVDPLLYGQTTLNGGVARTAEGLKFEDFKLSNSQLEANIDGKLASDTANISANAFIRDITVIDQNSSGKLSVNFDVTGNQAPFNLTSEIGMKNGKLSEQTVENLMLKLAGTSDGKSLIGDLSSTGFISGEDFDVAGNINTSDDQLAINDLNARIGLTRIDGDFLRQSNGLMDADLSVNSTDISSLAALLLNKASGAMQGSIELKPSSERTQNANFDVIVNRVKYETINIGTARIVGTASDVLTQPKINADIKVTDLDVSGTRATSLTGLINTIGSTSKYELQAQLAQHRARIATSGEIKQTTEQTTSVINKLSLQSNITDAQLISPSTIIIRDEIVQINGADLAIGSGRVNVSGTVGDTLNVASSLTNVPLAIVNAFNPELAMSGNLDGKVTVSGTPENPKVVFNANGKNVLVSQIAEAGLAPIQVVTRGEFQNDVVKLDTLGLQNSQRMNLQGAGNIPLTGSGLDLGLNGTVPLSILEEFVIERGTKILGTGNLAISLIGSLNQPKASGSIRVTDGTIIDPLSNLRLNNVTLNVDLAGSQTAQLRMQGNLASGGNVSANGNISLSSGLPANINILLNSAKYSDGETFASTVDGQFALDGKLAESPILSGNVNLLKTEITIPDSFASSANLIDVEHVSPSQNTAQTLARIDEATPKSSSNSSNSSLRLNLNINAPNQIFVRGRGLDAELGGNVRIVGPVSNISPQGEFTLKRGRLAILGQRLDLQEGTISLAGDLDPLLDFLASTSSSDVQAFIRLQGKASNLQVSFSSNPELPEDEVLAEIIFGRSVTDLSPIQIARLASVASELTGGNSPSLVNGLRASTGLDDLDVVQDDEGNAAVKAGTYVSDNVYLGVQAGQETEATINLDITDELKARGAVNSQGESTLGIFYEKDY